MASEEDCMWLTKCTKLTIRVCKRDFMSDENGCIEGLVDTYSLLNAGTAPFDIEANVDLLDQYRLECENIVEFLEEHFCDVELANLKALKVLNLKHSTETASILWGCLHQHTLTELDLAGCHLGDITDELQFWSVPNLTLLNLNGTKLSFLPTSIGRLRQLEKLSLNNNSLTSLPHTITFCCSLKELNVESNRLKCLPGSILTMTSLKCLRRYGNSMMDAEKSELAQSSRCHHFIRVTKERNMDSTATAYECDEVTPLKLLAIQSIMISKLDYWSSATLAPAVCRTLDLAQTGYTICDNCWIARPVGKPGWVVRWLVESYLGLQYVPFEHTACSERCANILADKFEKIQKRLRKEKDKEYEQLVRRYTTSEQPGDSSKRKTKRREMNIAETWQLDMGLHRRGSSRRRRLIPQVNSSRVLYSSWREDRNRAYSDTVSSRRRERINCALF